MKGAGTTEEGGHVMTGGEADSRIVIGGSADRDLTVKVWENFNMQRCEMMNDKSQY